MKLQLTGLTTALGLLAAMPASAAPPEGDWVEVTTTANGGATEFVDRSSLVRTGPVVRFKQRSDYINDPDHWVSALVDVEINCEARQMRPLSITLTLDDGKQRNERGTDDFAAITPDTVGEDVMLYVCKKPGA